MPALTGRAEAVNVTPRSMSGVLSSIDSTVTIADFSPAGMRMPAGILKRDGRSQASDTSMSSSHSRKIATVNVNGHPLSLPVKKE